MHNNVFQEYISKLIDVSSSLNLKRVQGTGLVMTPLNGLHYVYVKYKEPRDFVLHVFNHHPLPHLITYFNEHLISKIIKFIKQFDNPLFPFIKIDKRLIGFKNGVLDKTSLQFFNDIHDVVVDKYIDNDFLFHTDTPLLDTILDHYFNPDVRDFIYALLGRTFHCRDNWNVMPFFLGPPHSFLLDILSSCFSNVGVISHSHSPSSHTFFLSHFIHHDILISHNLPSNIHRLLDQRTLHSMISRSCISSPVIYNHPLNLRWTIPLVFAGSFPSHYSLDPSLSSRLLLVNFNSTSFSPPSTLIQRIIDTELPAFIYKCSLLYNQLLDKPSNDIWSLCPDYFLQQRHLLLLQRSPLYNFLFNNTIYNSGNSILMDDLRQRFVSWLGKDVTSLDNATFSQVNPYYKIFKQRICNSCNNPAGNGCCDSYNYKYTSTSIFVQNIDFVP